MLAPIALALASLGGGDAPADKEIEPIESSLVQFAIDADPTGGLASVCSSYGTVVDLLGSNLDDYSLAVELMDAYAVDMFEGGYSPDHSAHFTAEARDVFLDWLHAC